MTDTATPAKQPRAKSATGYAVLKQGFLTAGMVDVTDFSGAVTWSEVTVVKDAKTASEAIRLAVGKLVEEDRNGTFVAVPARSWRPVKVTPKTTTTLVVEEAS